MQASGVGLAIVHVHHRRRGHHCVGQTLTAAVVHTKLGPSTIRRDAGCRAKGRLMATGSDTTGGTTGDDTTGATSAEEIARAFSSHRFEAALSNFADDVIWTLVGASDPVVGRDAVRTVCASTAKDLANATTEFQRFRTVVGEDSVAVDSLARYTDPSGKMSVVASCDIYDFAEGLVTEIVSYTVEVFE